MKKHAWTGSTTNFTRALQHVEQCYQHAVHCELDAVLESQENVICRLRDTEKLAGSTNAIVQKQLDKNDLKSLDADLRKLELGLQLVQASVSECLAIIRTVDAQMPPRERVLALANEAHYPSLFRANSG